MAPRLYLPDEAATEDLGRTLARITGGRGLITLSGELGSGKTTLCRGLIRGAGHDGPVKSPTFTLLEPYEFDDTRIMHLDLYRLEDPEELDFIGFRDYLDGNTLCLVEWPERGRGCLPPADLAVILRHAGPAREADWQAGTPYGERLDAALRAHYELA